MKAVTWQAKRTVSVDSVPDPSIQEPTDAIIRITSTNICGSDLHLYETLTAFMEAGDILGHEPMGIVEEVGSQVTTIKPGDRVVIPFQMSCGHCFMCNEKLFSQCETTQVKDQGTGAALFGFSKLYGEVPGGQAEYLRVPQAQTTHIKVPTGPPDDRFVYLSDVLPTAWQAVQYADLPKQNATLAVFGLGPIGQMASRMGVHEGARVFGIDPVPERRDMAKRHGVEALDLSDDVSDRLRDLTDGRGPDAVIDAVGMEAHGAPVVKLMQTLTGMLPDPAAQAVMSRAGVDRMSALMACFDAVRRGGTVSISGVYGGMTDPLPMLQIFDKGLQIRMGQAHVKRWIDDLMPLVEDDADPLGVEDLATHVVPLSDAPRAYEKFQKKQDGAIKMVLRP
jgi:threonine dehydrogenase-like Zn-dependent dehydrogenase